MPIPIRWNEILKKGRLPILLCLMLLVGLGLVLTPTGEKKTEKNYALTLEERIAEMVSALCDHGGCKVMLTLESSGESVYAMQNLVDKRTPEVRGVAILCPGGDDPTIQKKIIELVEAVTGVGSNRISVCGIQ